MVARFTSKPILTFLTKQQAAPISQFEAVLTLTEIQLKAQQNIILHAAHEEELIFAFFL